MTEIPGDSSAIPQANCDSEEDTATLCLQSRRYLERAAPASRRGARKVRTEIGYKHCLVPIVLQITSHFCCWGVMDHYKAEALLGDKPKVYFCSGTVRKSSL